MRPEFEGDLAHSIETVQDDLICTLEALQTLLQYEHDALIVRQLIPAQRELHNARKSLAVAVIAAEQQLGK